MKKAVFARGVLGTVVLAGMMVKPVTFLNLLFMMVPTSSMAGQEVFLGLGLAVLLFAGLGTYVLSFWVKVVNRAREIV